MERKRKIFSCRDCGFSFLVLAKHFDTVEREAHRRHDAMGCESDVLIITDKKESKDA